MLILGIESSCDETAAAVVEDGRRVLSNIVASQVEEHKIYGGVVPEIASRRHCEAVSAVVKEALKQAGASLSDLGAVAVTSEPGLIGALLVGVSFAKGLALSAGLPSLAGLLDLAASSLRPPVAVRRRPELHAPPPPRRSSPTVPEPSA